MISVQFPLGFGRLRRPKSYFFPQILRIWAPSAPKIVFSPSNPKDLGAFGAQNRIFSPSNPKDCPKRPSNPKIRGGPPHPRGGAKGKGSSLSQGSYDLGALWS